MLFDREKRTTRELLPKFDRWVDEFVWGPAVGKTVRDNIATGHRPTVHYGLAIFFASGNEGQQAEYRVSIADGHITRLTDRGEFSDIVLTPDGKTIVAAGVTAERPAELYLVDADTIITRNDGTPGAGTAAEANDSYRGGFKEKGSLSHLNDAIFQTIDIGSMESFLSKGAEGAQVQGFVVRPPNFDAKKKYPLKFLIHGGPQGAWGDAWSYRWNAELMAASGYVVVMVNPRGSTGYGQAFIDGVNGDWGGKPYIDLMKGLDAAEAKFPFIDKTRECALGASYGGFMANWILTHTNRFACIVTHDGMYNPEAAYGDTEELWFNEWEFRRPAAAGASAVKGRAAGADGPGQPWRYAAGPVADDPFRKWSPMLSIQNAKTPTLVIHSQKDYRLDVSEGMQLFTALQRLGVPSRMLYFPDEGHWVLKPQNSKLWYEQVGDWCDRWTHTGKYAAQ